MGSQGANSQKEEESINLSSPFGGQGAYGYELADPITYLLLKAYALLHRSKPTHAEELLWDALKSKQLEGFKFRRQHIIGTYITDQVCLDRKLVIETDGLIHQLP